MFSRFNDDLEQVLFGVEQAFEGRWPVLQRQDLADERADVDPARSDQVDARTELARTGVRPGEGQLAADKLLEVELRLFGTISDGYDLSLINI